MKSYIFKFFLLSLLCSDFYASDALASSEEYYASIDDSSDEFKRSLETLLKQTHNPISYTTAWYALMEADEDPDNSENIILFYSQRSIPKSYKVSPTNNDPDAWNREHVWPKSYGFSDRRLSAYADIHNLRPSDQTINGRRGNMWFGDAGEDATLDPEAPENKYSKKKDLWEPRDEIKGDVARAVFYMAFRYSHASKNETKTPLVMNEINEIVHNAFGDAHDLAEWHQMDPPDEKEFHRNDIAEKFQGNRNPFIDRPEWAELIWPSLFK